MPDLNSVPESPRILALSRRTSAQQMPPPSAPAPASGTSSGSVPSDPALNILPSNLNAVSTGAPIVPSLPSPLLNSSGAPPQPSADSSSATSGPGPVRHPRPLTAAELHQELEKEQEAVVNRLTRELDLLRQAQNASVVSNTSSTSAGASTSGPEIPIIPDGRQHLLSGSGFSIPSSSGRERRHTRSGSSASARSIAATAGSASATGAAPTPSHHSHSVVNITAPAPIRPGATALSRQNSTQSQRQSLSSSPAHASSWASSHMVDAASLHGAANYFPIRSTPGPGAATSIPSSGAPTPGPSDTMSPSMLPATSRYEETAFYRQELNNIKNENEALKRRVRELERMVRERRTSDAAGSTRPRSESVSTTASVNVASGSATGASIAAARPRNERVVSMLSTTGSVTSVAVGVPEDEVKVGESAASGQTGLEGV